MARPARAALHALPVPLLQRACLAARQRAPRSSGAEEDVTCSRAVQRALRPTWGSTFYPVSAYPARKTLYRMRAPAAQSQRAAKGLQVAYQATILARLYC